MLQDDHEFITRQQKIVPVPAVITADSILNDFEQTTEDQLSGEIEL